MNKCNEEFIKKHNIDLSSFDTRIYTLRDINPIIHKYEVQGKTYNTNISMNDLVGFYEHDNCYLEFPNVMDDFFDEFGDGYHSRSVGLLSYDLDKLFDILSTSFKIEPIKTLEVDNKHVILTNGMHRFIVLRLLYLNERSKCSENDLDSLNQKYIIPIQTTKVDTTKTYCKYLIDIFNPACIMGRYFSNIEKENDYYFLTEIKGWNCKELVTLNEDEYQYYLDSVVSLGNEYDEYYNPTGRCQLKKFNGEKIVLTDQELIEFTRSIIINSKRNNEELFENINKYPSLKDFINNYFSDLFDLERGAILNDSVNKSR